MGECGAGFSHLHQRQQAFLHARTAAGRKTNKRHILFATQLHTFDETLADHRTHGAAHELKFEGRNHNRDLQHTALHHHQGIGLAGIFLRRFEALRVFTRVFKFQSIDRGDFGSDFIAPFRVEKQVQALTCRNPIVLAALGTNFEIFFQIGVIQHRLATDALMPQAFRYIFLIAFDLALDLGR